jgi:3-methyladenine DNA glycosylase Tag
LTECIVRGSATYAGPVPATQEGHFAGPPYPPRNTVAATIPDVIEPASLADYLELMTRAVFQAGVRWKQIAEPWDAYREAFAGFDPNRVAAYDEIDVERVLATPGILRTPKKVRATIANAAALLQADRDSGGFANYLASFDSYEALAKDFKKRFKFMGDMNVWYFLFRASRPVPRFESWITTIPGEHPRMREMVEQARAQGKSPEV